MIVLEFLALTAIWGWLALAGLAYIVHELSDRDRPGAASLVAVGTVALLSYANGFNPLSFVVGHPFWSVIGVIGYFVVGAVWGIVKWGFYSKALVRRADRITTAFLEEHKLPGNGAVPEDAKLQQAWRWALEKGGAKDYPPNVAKNRSRILTWMSYWPASMGWTFLDDPVRRAFVAIYNWMAGFLESIAERAVRRSDRLVQSMANAEKVAAQAAAGSDTPIGGAMPKARASSTP